MARSEERQSHDGDLHGERWEHIGRAAEHFARRMARDAGRFAERLEGNASHFAREVSREWQRPGRHHRRHWHWHERGGAPGETDVRRTFEDVRGILNDVLDGVDELIGRLFPDRDDAGTASADDAEPEWQRIVANREMSCDSCDRVVGAGEEVELRGRGREREIRCAQCRQAETPPDSAAD